MLLKSVNQGLALGDHGDTTAVASFWDSQRDLPN